jgi:hypothetical protein
MFQQLEKSNTDRRSIDKIRTKPDVPGNPKGNWKTGNWQGRPRALRRDYSVDTASSINNLVRSPAHGETGEEHYKIS